MFVSLQKKKMDEKACKVETDLLLKCWKVHGAEEVDETHPCNSAQDAYMRCVRINVRFIQSVIYYYVKTLLALDTHDLIWCWQAGRGLMRNKDIGGDYIYTYMWQFMAPLRENDNQHATYASKATHRSKGTSKKRMMWQGGKPHIKRKY